MALIKCPECGKEVSDKAEECIHCGYPIAADKLPDYDPTMQCPLCHYTQWMYSRVTGKVTCQHCGITIAENEYIARKYKEAHQSDEPTWSKPSGPRCPTCGSASIEKISATSKVTGGLLFGLFSSNVRKTFRCKNCGYKW